MNRSPPATLRRIRGARTDRQPNPSFAPVALRRPVPSVPRVPCGQCGKNMPHVFACSIQSACGGTFEVDPWIADLLDAELGAISWRNGDFFAWMVN